MQVKHSTDSSDAQGSSSLPIVPKPAKKSTRLNRKSGRLNSIKSCITAKSTASNNMEEKITEIIVSFQMSFRMRNVLIDRIFAGKLEHF